MIIARLIAPTRWRACWAHHRDPFGSYKDLVNEAFAMYRNKASLYRNKGWDWLKDLTVSKTQPSSALGDEAGGRQPSGTVVFVS